jgi:hypothetical protein
VSRRRGGTPPDQLGLFGGPDAAASGPAAHVGATRSAWRIGRAPTVPFALWAGTAWIIRETSSRTAKVAEAKYDGIRAQAHVDGPRVRLFSRTLDDVTASFPEVAAALAFLGHGLVLDGELLAVHDGDAARPQPFRALQQRLGRRAPDAAVMREVPVAFIAYDVLAADHALCVDDAWSARRARLEALPWEACAMMCRMHRMRRRTPGASSGRRTPDSPTTNWPR